MAGSLQAHMHIISQWIVWNVDCEGMTRVIISWNPAGTKTSLIFFSLYISAESFSSKPCCQKCLDLSSSSSYSSSFHHLLFVLLLHHPLMLLSSGRLVRLISPPMDSLLLPHCELRLFTAWLCGRQTCRSWAVGRLQTLSFLSFFLKKTYLWKAVCLLSFPFRYSAKPDLMCFFLWATKLHWGAQLLMSQMINEMIQCRHLSSILRRLLDCHEWMVEF